jgi:hypothetical protein
MAIGPDCRESMHVGMASPSTYRIVSRPTVRANYSGSGRLAATSGSGGGGSGAIGIQGRDAAISYLRLRAAWYSAVL